MEPNFEDNITIPAIIAGFVVLTIISTFIQRRFREKALIKDGQITTEGGRIPSIEERIAGNKAWASGEIHSKGRNLMFAVWLVAIVMTLTLGVSFIKSFSNPEMKTGGIVALGFFNIFSLGFTIFAIRLTLRYLRFGESICRITGKAGVLNKSISGIIQNKNDIPASGDYTIRLACIETYHTGSGKNRKTESRIHWESKQQVSHLGKSTKLGIPFSFTLPKYPPETGDQLTRGNVNWRLAITAPVKGVDYSAEFTVPVFKMDYSE